MRNFVLAAAVALTIAAAGCGSSRPAEGSEAGCGSCHGFPPVSPHPQPAAGIWAATDCATCHLTSVNATTGEVIPVSAGGTHANGTVEAGHALDGSFAPGSVHGPVADAGLSSCKPCHGANLDGVGGTTTKSCDECHTGGTAWRTNCTFCHGDSLRAATPNELAKSAPPADVSGSLDTVDIGVGAHERHVVDRAIGCTICHPSVPTDIFSAGHVDGGPANIAFGGLAVTGGLAPAWDRTAARCATTYCHGGGLTDGGGTNTTPLWTSVGTGQAACGTCHGLPVAATSHPQPWTGATWTGADCSLCHSTSVDGTGQLLAAHLDGATPSAPNCTTCHDLTVPPRSYLHTRVSASATSPLSCGDCHTGWVPNGHTSDGDSKTSTVSCTSCHGTGDGAVLRNAAPPVDVYGGTAPAKVGKHAVHLDGGAYANGFACTTCHADVAGYTKSHANGAADVGFAGAVVAGGSYASGTCSSTYCHGNFTGGATASPTWTGTIACNSCHEIAPATGRHALHAGQSVGCGSCHTGYTSTSVNKTLHVNGVKNVAAFFDTTTRTCGGCHAVGSESW